MGGRLGRARGEAKNWILRLGHTGRRRVQRGADKRADAEFVVQVWSGLPEASRADDDTAERDCAAVCRVDGRVDGGRGSAARRVPHRKISGPKEARSLTASPAKRTVMSHVTNEQRT